MPHAARMRVGLRQALIGSTPSAHTTTGDCRTKLISSGRAVSTVWTAGTCADMDRAVADQFDPEHFVTAQVLQLDTTRPDIFNGPLCRARRCSILRWDSRRWAIRTTCPGQT